LTTYTSIELKVLAFQKKNLFLALLKRINTKLMMSKKKKKKIFLLAQISLLLMKVLWFVVFNQLYLKPLRQAKKKDRLYFAVFNRLFVEFQTIPINQF